MIHKPTPVWYIENDLFVYQQYDSEEECLTIFNSMKSKNPDLKEIIDKIAAGSSSYRPFYDHIKWIITWPISIGDFF